MATVITCEQRELLINIIKLNKNYKGNENLLEEFLSCAYSKLKVFFDEMKDITTIEPYINKVVSTSMIYVIKNANNINSKKINYLQVKTDPLEVTSYVKNNNIGNLSHQKRLMYEIVDPKQLTSENKCKNIDNIKNVPKMLYEINIKHKEKQYINIFKLRFINKKTQSQIAFELNLSKYEVARRLMEIIHLLKCEIVFQ